MEAGSSVTATARTDAGEQVERRGPDAFFAEFIGTFLLVMFICFAATLNSGPALGFVDWSVLGLVHFLALAVLVHTLGGVSGAHLNPAVTVTLAALRRIQPADAAVYVVLQLLGGLVGALVVRLVLDDVGAAAAYGAPAVSERLLEGRVVAGFVVEAIGAFVLMWAIMGVAVDPRGARAWAGFAIGGALGLAVWALGPMTGGSFNPARAFGPTTWAEAFGGVGDFVVVFVLGPLVGALLAGTLYAGGILGGGAGRRPVDTLSGEEPSVRAPKGERPEA